jgi:hypothetical protein
LAHLRLDWTIIEVACLLQQSRRKHCLLMCLTCWTRQCMGIITRKEKTNKRCHFLNPDVKKHLRCFVLAFAVTKVTLFFTCGVF